MNMVRLAMAMVVLLGMGRFTNPDIEGVHVTQFSRGGCAEGMPFEVEQKYNHPDMTEWTATGLNDPGICVATNAADMPLLRACCTFAGLRTCVEAEVASGPVTPCEKIIYLHNSRGYSEEDVTRWNEIQIHSKE